MGAKKKNQSKNTAFYWYMQSIMPELRKNGRNFTNGLADIVPVARPMWKRLTPAEREPFEKRAKDEKRKSKGLRPDTERLDNLGEVIALRENKEDLLNAKRESDRRKAKATWPYGQGLVDKKFYLIAFEVLCELEDPDARGNHDYIPREVAVIEWCMRSGIRKELHRFIFTDGIPMGFRFNAQEHMEKHMIPIEDFDPDDRNWRGLWEEILNFVNPNQELEEYPPIYCLLWQYRKIVSCMDWLHDHALSQGFDEGNILQDKLYILDDCVQDMFTHSGAITVSLNSVDDMLNTTAFDHEPMTRCQFHEDEGCTVCALGTVKRCVFSMADSLVEHFDFELTHRHVPDPSLKRPEYSVINPTPANIPAPPPSQNQQRSLGPFASRDIRYQEEEDDEGNQVYVSDEEEEEEALGVMLDAQQNRWNPAGAQARPPFATPQPLTFDDEDDFPALGAMAKKPAAPPQSRPAWLQQPPPARPAAAEKAMPTLAQAAAAKRQEEQEREQRELLREQEEQREQQRRRQQQQQQQQQQIPWGGPGGQQQQSAWGGPSGPRQAGGESGWGGPRGPMPGPPAAAPRQPPPPQTRPAMMGLRPAFAASPGGMGRGVVKLPGAGAGAGRGAPKFVPPSPPRSQPRPSAAPSGYPPMGASGLEPPTSQQSSRPKAPAFIPPPSGDGPVYKPPPQQTMPPPGIGRGRGMSLAFTGEEPQAPPPQPQLPPQPTSRPQGLGRGRGSPLRPPPGFSKSSN